MRWRFITLSLVVICVAIGLAFWNDNSSRQVLADGTVLVLSGVRIGHTNTYVHGSFLSKTLGRLAPFNAISIAGFKLQSPLIVSLGGSDGCEILSAQVHLMPGSPQQNSLASPTFHRRYRLLISGDDGFGFVKEFDGFKTEPDGLFSFIRAESFPRDSKQLRFRLEEREKNQSRDWREVTTFVVKNPKPAHIENWTPEISPRFKLSDDLEVQIGGLTIVPEPINPVDIWEPTALLPVRVTYRGQLSTNWGVHSGPMWDASGNHETFTFSKVITNDWMVYRIFRPLDPSKAWRFDVNVAMDSDFPATNLFSFTIPWPYAGTMQTNLGGFPARVGFVNQSMLSVELITEPPESRLSFVSAVDNAGNNIADFSGSWGQHNFWQSLKLTNPAQVRVTVAIHRNYRLDFTLQPHFDPSHPEIGRGLIR